MNHILIDNDNHKDFNAVLPLSVLPDADRITIGAYTDEGDVAGAISFFLADCRYTIDWFYVTPPMRRQKVATGLLDEVFTFISKTGLIYPVSAEYEVTEDDDSLFSFFYERREMDTEFAFLRYYVRPVDLASSEELKRGVEVDLEDKEFFSLPRNDQNRYLDRMISDHIFLIEDKKAFEGVCIPKLSRVILKDGKLMAAIFIAGRNDGNMELSYLYSANPIATKLIISRVAADITAYYPRAKLIFDVVGENAAHMARKLFPKAKTVKIYESNW